MKRLLAVCLMIVLLLPCAALAAEKTKVDRYEVTYEAADGCCTIVSISDPLRGYGGALPMELPEQLGGYTVTVLGAGALAEHSTVEALLSGNLQYGADFDTGRSQISVWLTGYDNFAYIYVYYCSQDIVPQLRDQSGNF